MISILLPTVRPHLAMRAISSLGPACGNALYEIVVVADFSITERLENCVWIQRERRGVIDAIKVAYDRSRGEYLFVFNDESVMEPWSLQRLYAEAVKDPTRILHPVHLPPYPFFYYGLPFAPFPFVRRDVVEWLGGLFDPAYKGFYADPDFSLRAHAAGVPIREVPGAVLHHANNIMDPSHVSSVGSYLAADRELFRKRWDHLGEFRDP